MMNTEESWVTSVPCIKKWLPTLIFSPSGRDKSEGAGGGNPFFRSLLGVWERKTAAPLLFSSGNYKPKESTKRSGLKCLVNKTAATCVQPGIKWGIRPEVWVSCSLPRVADRMRSRLIGDGF